MALPVQYTPTSRSTLNDVYRHISDKFGKIAANRFLNKAERVISLVAENPMMYKSAIFDENVRIALITPQTSLFYRISDHTIQLLFFWDNRQDQFIIES